MDRFFDEVAGILRVVMGGARPFAETAVVAVVGSVAMLVVLQFAGAAFGVRDRGSSRRVIGLVLGVVIMLAAAAATSLYLVPMASTSGLRRALMVGVPVLSALAIAIPMQCLILRSAYLSCLLAFVSAVAASVLVIYLTNTVIDSARAGGRESHRITDRKRQIEDVVGR